LKKVLVTGGTGFLGAYIIQELLKKDYAVRALRRSPKLPAFIPATVFEKVEWVEGDVLDILSLQDAMEGMDMVIHSAAIVSFHRKDRAKMYQVNIEGTANVVNMALEAGIRRLVHISSIAALGRTSDGRTVNEEKKWEENKNNTHYARSKYKAELEVWRAMAEGLNAVILNPSTILGYGDWHSGSCAIFRNVYNEFGWYSPGLNGFVDVEDVARATVLMMETDITEERFIVNGDNWPFKRLLHTMADAFGKKRASRETKAWILGLAWRLEALKSWFGNHKPLLTKESARVAHSRTVFDSTKLLKVLPGFEFKPLEQSIREACGKYVNREA
jgi:nucleoside-diphosphate-sugar epimerase